MKCCPNYNGNDKIGLIRTPINGSYSLPFQTIKQLRHGFGELKKCTVCNTVWLIQPNKDYLELISSNMLKSILLWGRKDLSVKQNLLKTLTDIGETPFLVDGKVSKDHICIPCKCTLTDGRIIDYCIVNIQKKPPLRQKQYENVLFIDQVVKIEASEFSLPLSVRVETTNAGYYPEVDEYDPTIIETLDKEPYYIDYGDNFFFENGIEGKRMQLKSYKHPLMDKNPTFIKNKIIETQIIADWTIELEKSFNSKK